MIAWIKRLPFGDEEELLRDLYAEWDLLHVMRRKIIAEINQVEVEIEAVEARLAKTRANDARGLRAKESGEARLVFVLLLGVSSVASVFLGWALIRYGEIIGPLLSALRTAP